MTHIRVLQEEIKYKGFVYRQVNSNDRGYVYQQMSGNRVISYEVFRRITRKPVKLFNEDFDLTERFPTDEAFGVWAWCVHSKQEAFDILKDL